MTHRRWSTIQKCSFVFGVVAAASLRAGEAVMSSTNILVDGTRETVTVSKVMDTKTGMCRIAADIPEIKYMRDLDVIRESRDEYERQVNGVVRGYLRDTLAALQESDTVRVHVRLKTPQVRYLNRFKHSQAELRAQSEALLTIQPLVSPQDVLERYGFVPHSNLAAGSSFVCYATKRMLERAKHDGDIAEISLSKDPELLATGVPFSRLALYALNPSAHPSDQQGSGVHVATFEDGLPRDCQVPSPTCGERWDYLSCKGLVDDIYCYYINSSPDYCAQFPNCSAPRCPTGPNQACPTSCCDYSIGTACAFYEHTVKCFTCLLNAAPLAVPHHVVGTWETGLGHVEASIVRWQLETTSQSTTTTTLDEDLTPAINMDDWAYRWPYPLLCNPAGNNGGATEVNWQGYNGISVGSTKKLWGNYYVLDEFSNGRNPDPKYGQCLSGSPPSCPGDREMPEILAPGSNPYTYNCLDPNYYWYDVDQTQCFSSFGPSCGTSYSAPILNGIAARLASSCSYRYMPDVLKLILLLTAQNVHGGDWNVATDDRDGVGVVSAYSAVEYATTTTQVWAPGPPAVEKGLYTGSGYEGMPQYIDFQVKIPSSLPSGKHLRAALVWTSNPDLNAGQNSLSDLDIRLCANGGTWYWSTSWDASVEVIDVPASALTPGSTYTLTVMVWDVRIPAGSRADWFYYDLGWTWVKDHAP